MKLLALAIVVAAALLAAGLVVAARSGTNHTNRPQPKPDNPFTQTCYTGSHQGYCP
jgi:hypothetical protein